MNPDKTVVSVLETKKFRFSDIYKISLYRGSAPLAAHKVEHEPQTKALTQGSSPAWDISCFSLSYYLSCHSLMVCIK